MKKTIICITILFCSIISLGQLSHLNQTDSNKVIHKLGMHAGTTSGLGLSYKALFKNKTMIQLVTLPIASKDYKYINSGISLKQKLKDYPEWDFLPNEDLNRKTIEIYLDMKIAKRICSKEQKVIKVPNTDVFRIAAPILNSRGISRIVSPDKLIAL